MVATKNGARSSKALPFAGIMTRVQPSLITALGITGLILITPAIIRIAGGRVIGMAGAMGTDMDGDTEAGATTDGGEIIPPARSPACSFLKRHAENPSGSISLAERLRLKASASRPELHFPGPAETGTDLEVRTLG